MNVGSVTVENSKGKNGRQTVRVYGSELATFFKVICVLIERSGALGHEPRHTAVTIYHFCSIYYRREV